MIPHAIGKELRDSGSNLYYGASPSQTAGDRLPDRAETLRRLGAGLAPVQLSTWLQRGAMRHHAVLGEAPQGNQ